MQNEPAAHCALLLDVPAAQYVRSTHGVVAVAFARQKLPAGHKTCEEGVTQNQPAAHGEFAEEPAAQYEPDVHGVTAVEPEEQ